MSPKRYLSTREVGKRLGLSTRAVSERLQRGAGGVPAPDVVIGEPGTPGCAYGWDGDREDLVPAVDDPALLGDDPDALPDDMLIGPKMWAKLQGASEDTVRWNRSQAALRRAEGDVEPWDMPEADLPVANRPRWRMSTYRAWLAAQEGLKAAHPGVWANAKRG